MSTTSIAITLASLVSKNDGLFKTEKQAAFLLSQSDCGEIVTGGSVYGNSFSVHYKLDSNGVVEVSKYTTNKGMVLTWTRPNAESYSVQDLKEIKRLKRQIAETEKEIVGRIKAFDEGQYADIIALFHECNDRSVAKLAKLNEMLITISKV